MKTLNIVTIVSTDTVNQTSVMLKSVIHNSSIPVSIYLITYDWDDKYRSLLDQLCDENCTIQYYAKEEYESVFVNVISKLDCSFSHNEIFARLLLFFIPFEIDDCFFVTHDAIVDIDLNEHQYIRPFSVVVDSFSMEKRGTVLSHLSGIDEFKNFNADPLHYPYFNTGFFHIDLQKCKEERIWEKILAFFEKHSNMPFADQDILNAVIGQNYASDIEYLPPSYNVFCASTIDHSVGHRNGYYSQEETIDAYAHPRIYHYAGPEKPWFYPICQYYDVWWKYAAESPAFSCLIQLVSSRWSTEVKLHINTLNRLHVCEDELSQKHLLGNTVKPVSDQQLAVVLTGDGNYVDQLNVTMTSVLENVNKNYSVHFILFISDFTEDNKTKLLRLKYYYPCIIEFIDVSDYLYLFDKADVSSFQNKHVSMACYYRLLIFYLLPSRFDSCFYVDGDMIVATDLTKLISSVQSHLLSVVVESFAMENRDSILMHLQKYEEFHNFQSNPLNYPYFNAGFLGINLKKCKEERIWEKILAFFEKHSNMPFADQDILNAVIGQNYASDIEYLPPSYNVFCASTIDHSVGHRNGYYSQEETIDAYAHPRIYHYAGPEKPWFYPICQYYDVWWKYAIKSSVYDDLMELAAEKWQREVKLHIGTLNKLHNLELTSTEKSFKDRLYQLMIKDPRVKSRFDDYVSQNGVPHSLKAAFKLSSLNISKNRIIDRYQFESFIYNQNLLFNAVDKYSVISFDLYDTLICRVFIDPTNVWHFIEKTSGRPGFVNERIRADREARSHCDKEDVTLNEIYTYIADEYHDLMKFEERVEYQTTIRNPSLYEVYNYAVSKKKKIVFLSDMYLPLTLISTILDKCGYNYYDHLYLSSETGRLKRGGTAFEFMLSDMDIKAKNVLHIGDTFDVDYLGAVSKGMHSICVMKNSDALFKDYPRLLKYYSDNIDLNSSILIGLLSLYRNEIKNYWDYFGYFFAGPTIYAFCSWLRSQLIKDGLSTIYFIARDGYTLQKAMELLYPGEFKTYYVYAPRRLSNICNLDLDLKFSFGDWTSEFADSIYQNYFSQQLKDKIGDWNKLSLSEKNKWIASEKDVLTKVSLDKIELYRKYLNNISGESTVALVDSTTTFFSSQKMVARSRPDLNVIGYYWVINTPKYDDGSIPLDRQRSFMPGHENKIKDWDIMEFVLTSPEPPIVDISEDLKPVYKKENNYDRERSKAYSDISAGALKFIKVCADNEFVRSNFVLSPVAILEYINMWIDNPTETDKVHFKNMRLPVRCEHDQYVPVFKPWFTK